jgi:hypothetical protein
MEIQVSGYENNRPVLTTYRIPDETLAEAIARSDVGKFNVSEGLDKSKQFALVDEKGEFSGLIMFWDDAAIAMVTTFLKTDWEPGAKFQVHDIEELDSKLNY